jgi:hypothetical protein
MSNTPASHRSIAVHRPKESQYARLLVGDRNLKAWYDNLRALQDDRRFPRRNLKLRVHVG